LWETETRATRTYSSERLGEHWWDYWAKRRFYQAVKAMNLEQLRGKLGSKTGNKQAQPYS